MGGRTAKKKRVLIFCLTLFIFFTVTTVDSAENINGKIEIIKDKMILYLWGTNYQKGYAHGFLLAKQIIDILENYMLGEMYVTQSYSFTTRLLMYYVRIPQSFRMEILGMYNGMVDALGNEGIYSIKLGRHFKPIDLIRWNMFEIYPLEFEILPLEFEDSGLRKKNSICSSVSAWGDGTEDGALVFARDLDFGSPESLLERSSIIIVHTRQKKFFFSKKSWISIAWPGFIGCVTGMNENGVGAAVNFGNSSPSVEELLFAVPKKYTPLSFVLREVLEKRRYGIFNRNPITHFYKNIKISHIAGSFNVHVFQPYHSARLNSDPPAAVIEGNHRRVALRTYKENQADEPRLYSDYFLAVTNHHRKLIEPEPCERYETMVEALNAIEFIDMDTALEIERDVAQSKAPFYTLQMIGFSPDTKGIWVSFGDEEHSSYEVEPVHFFWDEIFQ